MGKTLKNIYVNTIPLFDKVILYGGEDSVFNTENLLRQLDTIVQKAKANEIRLNAQRKVEMPYGGPEAYYTV